MSDLRCTYCGGSLWIDCEYVGLAYMSENTPVGIECSACDADWETDGTLRNPAKWIRYPDLYAAPEVTA